MKNHLITKKRRFALTGFTLVEMTIVMLVGMLIAAASLTLFNYQLTTYKIINTQNFLIHEAPQINNTLNRIVSRANFFRLYATTDDAANNENSTITNAKVLALQFNGITQDSNSFGVIAFNQNTNSLDYYHLQFISQLSTATPAWSISSQVNDAIFYVENGVLRTKVTGPNGAEIIHSTTTQR